MNQISRRSFVGNGAAVSLASAVGLKGAFASTPSRPDRHDPVPAILEYSRRPLDHV
jgi:hypothetical protein